MEAVHGGLEGLQGQCQHKLHLLYSGQCPTVCAGSGFICTNIAPSAATELRENKAGLHHG